MEWKITCLQMRVRLGDPESNFARMEALFREATAEKPDVVVLPETWNTGFFPKEGLASLSCRNGEEVKDRVGSLAREYGINVVAGSVADLRDGKVRNTAMVFDRKGELAARYDKAHLFSPAGEDRYFEPGKEPCRFSLDGVPCGLALCYDLRFPEWIRATCLPGVDVFFLPSQWPKERIRQLFALREARAIENQVFLVNCNACGASDKTRFGGDSAVLDPMGELLAKAGDGEEILSAVCSLDALSGIREAIPVFRDRRPELYTK